MTEKIEQPMKMNYRESYAWQLGYEMGWKQAKQEFIKDIVLILSKNFQSVSDKDFIVMTENMSKGIKEIYDYLKEKQNAK